MTVAKEESSVALHPSSGATTTTRRRRRRRKANVTRVAAIDAGEPHTVASVPATKPQENLTHDAVAAKAYELWQMRGGDADFNWFEAQRLVKGDI